MTFFIMMKKDDNVYVTLLIIQAIGIAINFIGLIFGISFNKYIKCFIYLISVIIPLIVNIIEFKGKNFAEILKIFCVKILLKTRNNKLAKKILLELVSKYPNSYDAHKLLAEVYEKEGGMRKAIDEYVKAVDLNKKDYDSYYRISFLLNDLGNKEEAKEMLKNMLAKKPDHLNAIILLGDIYCDLEEYKEALNIYSGGLRYFPNDYDLLYSMGIAYTMLNDFQAAKICYEKAATINTLLFKAYYNIAQINLISNDLDEAEKYFTIVIEDKELEPDAYYQLGKIYMLRGDKENAIKFVNLAIKLDNKFIKRAFNEPVFIPIASRFDVPIVDEEDIVEKPDNLTEQEKKVRIHLEKTYKVVDMLSISRNDKEKSKENNEREL
jgi:tetratricopeptide (TPR) repeat protein